MTVNEVRERIIKGECLSDMFRYNFYHYHITDSFEDNITKKMKAIFRMVAIKR